MKQQLIDTVKKFNTVRSYPPSTLEVDIEWERISTRIIVLLTVVCILILTLYSSLVIVTRSFTIKSPSVSLYLKLYGKYSNSLICPCTTLAVKYGQFISVGFQQHPVCTSDFVSEKWTNPMINMSSSDTLRGMYQHKNQFTFWGPTFFRLLSGLCQLSQKTIIRNLDIFNSTALVTANVLTNNIFHSYSQVFIDSFKQNMIESFNRSMSLVRETTIGNGLVSVMTLNGIDLSDSLKAANINLTYSMYYRQDLFPLGSGCNCFSTSFCKARSKIDTNIVPGVYLSCSTIEATLLSDLRCIYDQICLNKLESAMTSVYVPFQSTAMDFDELNLDVFQPKSRVQQIFDQLMVNQWQENVSFNLYFEQCKPVVCTYTFSERLDLTYIVTTIIGLLGGLTVSLKNIVPPVVKYLRRKRNNDETNIGKFNWHNFFRLYYQPINQTNQVVDNYTKLSWSRNEYERKRAFLWYV